MTTSVYDVAPYGSIEDLLSNSTTRFSLIRSDLTIIGDLSDREANLFATAQELLDLAKSSLAIHIDECDEKSCSFIRSLRAAIDKSEGKT